MNQTKKICKGCNQEKYIWKNHQGNRYCKYCWQKTKNKTKSKSIASFSAKRVKESKEYSKLRKIYLNKHPMCEAAINDCSLKATEIHHIKGRGSNYLLCDEWMSVCRNCHEWIENNPIEATELGFRKSKIK